MVNNDGHTRGRGNPRNQGPTLAQRNETLSNHIQFLEHLVKSYMQMQERSIEREEKLTRERDYWRDIVITSHGHEPPWAAPSMALDLAGPAAAPASPLPSSPAIKRTGRVKAEEK